MQNKNAGWITLYLCKRHAGQTTETLLPWIMEEHLRRNAQKIPQEPLQVARSQRGKPYFPQLPQLHGSVSHSGDWFVCAVSTQGVGVDLQRHALSIGNTRLTLRQRLQKLAHRYFTADEAAFAAEDSRRFFLIWTAKESYAKLTGQGIDSAFSRNSVLGSTLPKQNGARVCWKTESAAFQAEEFIPGYTICTASEAPAQWEWVCIEPQPHIKNVFPEDI